MVNVPALQGPIEGPCAMCQERPADYLGLVCSRCKAAIDDDEEWTLAYDDVLFRLREAERDDEDGSC